MTKDNIFFKCLLYRLGTWLRDISSWSCLTFLPGPAWVLLSKICKYFFSALYNQYTNNSGHPLRKMKGRLNFILMNIFYTRSIQEAILFGRMNQRSISEKFVLATFDQGFFSSAYLLLQREISIHRSIDRKSPFGKRNLHRATLLVIQCTIGSDPKATKNIFNHSI